MRVIGIIPARGASKTIPRKNLQRLRGVPLLAYSIMAAKAATGVDGCWVSTDDDEIAQVAQAWGMGALARPAHLATDEARTADVILDALHQLTGRGIVVDAIVTLQPTSPLREAGVIDQALDALVQHDVDTVMTVTRISAKVGHVQDERFEPLYPFETPRQLLKPLYRENGNLYVTRTPALLAHRSLFGRRIYPLVLDGVQGLDIDTPADLWLAEVWLERCADRFPFQEVRT
jgi:CMP-N-acetylneuraminic acid synthetase